MVGHKVSFSNKKYKRRFHPNLIKKTFQIPSENREVTLTISTKALRTVNKIGIVKALKIAGEKGYYKG